MPDVVVVDEVNMYSRIDYNIILISAIVLKASHSDYSDTWWIH